MMDSASYDITVRQGDTFRFEATYQGVNLTGYTAEMVISWGAYRSDEDPPVQAGEIMPTMAALGPDGKIVATMTNAQTSTIPVGGRGRAGPHITYQLRIRVANNPVTTLLSGSVDVRPNVFDLVT